MDNPFKGGSGGKLAGVPKKVWAGALIGGLGLGLYMRHRSKASAATTDTTGQNVTADQTGSATSSYDPSQYGSPNQYGLPGGPGPYDTGGYAGGGAGQVGGGFQSGDPVFPIGGSIPPVDQPVDTSTNTVPNSGGSGDQDAPQTNGPYNINVYPNGATGGGPPKAPPHTKPKPVKPIIRRNRHQHAKAANAKSAQRRRAHATRGTAKPAGRVAGHAPKPHTSIPPKKKKAHKR